MILGMSLATYTLVHVIISLIAIATGLIVLFGLLTGRLLKPWNGIFLLFTVLTSAGGYLFPFVHLLPSHIIGAISLVLLAVAILALYGFHLNGAWRRTYVITALFALYLNMFVLVFQLFLKVPAIHALAPTQSEAPFKIAQLTLLVVFIALIVVAAKKFRTPLTAPR
jgi:hypothetical protein